MPAPLIIYSAVGVLNTLTDFIAFTFLTLGLGCGVIFANVFSYMLGGFVSFVLNRHVTFRRSPYKFGVRAQILRFFTISLLSTVMSTGIVYVLSKWMSPIIAKTSTIPFILIWGFIASRIFVFTPSSFHRASKSAENTYVENFNTLTASVRMDITLNPCPTRSRSDV